MMCNFRRSFQLYIEVWEKGCRGVIEDRRIEHHGENQKPTSPWLTGPNDRGFDQLPV